MGSLGEPSHTPFRLCEKYWKSRAGPSFPSLVGQNVLDLSRPEGPEEEDEVWRAGWWAPPPPASPEGWSWKRKSRKGKEVDRGIRPPVELSQGVREVQLRDGRKGWIVGDGCVLLPGYLSAPEQLALLRAALSEYTLPPNPLSLSTHYTLPPDLFSAYANDDITPIAPKWTSLSEEEQAKYAALPRLGRTTIETLPGSVVGYNEILSQSRTGSDGASAGGVPSSSVNAKTAAQLMQELRWANLGWVYQWTTKSYDFSPETPIAFPKELARKCQEAVGCVPWDEVYPASSDSDQAGPADLESRVEGQADWRTWADSYCASGGSCAKRKLKAAPDTGIVNFYQLKDTLMGHVDRAELDPSRPLVSISLGHACIFLLGSSSRQDPPRPIVLRSGDVLIMSGKSRQSYHGVPRIMEGTLPSHFHPMERDDETMAACKRYIAGARVNINAREVFPPGFERPRAGDNGLL